MINPIADILPVNGIPKFVIANDEAVAAVVVVVPLSALLLPRLIP
jgi:hypothetical protein